jgi:hypothetical protein
MLFMRFLYLRRGSKFENGSNGVKKMGRRDDSYSLGRLAKKLSG